MSARKIVALLSALSLATACTAIIGLEDLPPAPVYDAGSTVPTPTPEASTAVDAGSGDVLPAAVAAYSRAFCTRYKDCQGPLFQYVYRDAEECAASIVASVTWSLKLPGSGETAKGYQDCATNVTALACDKFASSDADFACAIRGTRKVNDRCLTNSQCETGFCGSDNTTCRGCVNPPDNGLPCAAGDQCGPGLVCNPKKLCVTQAAAGQTCNDDKPCVYPLACQNGTCTALPATTGAVCGAAGCDTTKGFVCSAGKCKAYTISGPSGGCGSTADTTKICRLNAVCGDAGTCGEIAKEGDNCATDNSDRICPWPLRCVNKKCVGLPASSTCE